jgi:hypothetical protein
MTATGKRRRKYRVRKMLYASPEPLPPDPHLVQHYLHAAQPDRPEAIRADARRKLLQLHENRALTGLPAFRVGMFVDDLTIEVWSSNNPGEELAAVRKGTPKRGRGRPRTRENEYSDFMISADVEERRRSGLSRDEACGEVAKLVRLSFERVVSIYSDQMKRKGTSVRLEVSCRAVRNGHMGY